MTSSDPAPAPPAADASAVDLDRASTLVGAALDDVGAWLLERSGELEARHKPDGTVVTDADTTVDERLHAALLSAYPDHGILSEERGTLAPNTDWTWVIDPVDGTSNYTNRLPYWCISVALLHRGHPQLGVIDAPVLGRRYVAVAGGGAIVRSRTTSLDGTDPLPRERPLAVRDAMSWRDPRNGHVPVMMATSTARRARGAGLALNPRVMGSMALDLAMVAEGVAAASIARAPKVWDIAAGTLLVREAGGVVVTIDDQPLLPLTPGTEQQGRSALTAAGPDEAYVRELVAALLA